jgi:hypothetical protein
VLFDVNDDARLISTLSGNIIFTQGTDGVRATASNTSELVLDLVSNQIQNAPQESVQLLVEDEGRMFAFVVSNSLFTPSGRAQSVLAEIDPAALAAAELCLQLNSNFASAPYQLNNNSVGSMFRYEDNGLNIPNTINTMGTVTLVPAGTCATAAAPLRVFP